MKVIDASVAVKWFVEESGREAAMALVRSGQALTAPDIVVFEVLNVLRRKQRQKLIDAGQLTGAVEMMALCFSRLVPSASLAEEAVRLSIELDHPVYDCAYLSCATLLKAPLVTADRTFATKILAVIPGCPVQVIEP